MTVRPRRSALYVPGSNARAVEKSRTLPADALIFDLEDSVNPAEKPGARRAIANAVAAGGFGPREVVIRINPLDTEWGHDDLRSAAAAGPDAILLPKVATSGEVMFAAADLARAGAPGALRLWAMMETPAAILNAAAIARTAADPASRLAVLVMGTNDLAKDTRVRIRPGREALATWLSICVAAARCHDLDVLDGVYGTLGDDQGLRRECEQGRDFGMDGKTCIHPDQIATCNEVFSPQPDEVDWARRVAAVFAVAGNAEKNVLLLDGRMVERLHLAAARRTLALSETIDRQRPEE